MNVLSNKLIATIGYTIGYEVQLKHIIDDIHQEQIIENKRNMREFIKNKCKKRGVKIWKD